MGPARSTLTRRADDLFRRLEGRIMNGPYTHYRVAEETPKRGVPPARSIPATRSRVWMIPPLGGRRRSPAVSAFTRRA